MASGDELDFAGTLKAKIKRQRRRIVELEKINADLRAILEALSVPPSGRETPSHEEPKL